jgi:hypothetical protein
MQSSIFGVNDTPYCLWEADLAARTHFFLDGIDPDYFDYVLQTHLNAEDEKRTLVAIKLSLHHAIETMFSLLGALVQAPDCPYAWIAKCSNTDLREFAERVRKKDSSLITKLNIPSISWASIANLVYTTYQPGTERQKNTVECFGRFWDALTAELVTSKNNDEYNAFKHGFRARPGGFTLAVGIESKDGTPPSDYEMQIVGKSDFGATFFTIETLGSAKPRVHIRSRRTSLNWSFERIILLHQLVHMSIHNVVSALKVVNNYSPDTCSFIRPENDTDFEQPWTHGSGATSMSFDAVLDERRLPKITKEELLCKLRAQ